jgi:hypothetical protein
LTQLVVVLDGGSKLHACSENKTMVFSVAQSPYMELEKQELNLSFRSIVS